jgi:hypothetical protein
MYRSNDSQAERTASKEALAWNMAYAEKGLREGGADRQTISLVHIDMEQRHRDAEASIRLGKAALGLFGPGDIIKRHGGTPDESSVSGDGRFANTKWRSDLGPIIPGVRGVEGKISSELSLDEIFPLGKQDRGLMGDGFRHKGELHGDPLRNLNYRLGYDYVRSPAQDSHLETTEWPLSPDFPVETVQPPVATPEEPEQA